MSETIQYINTIEISKLWNKFDIVWELQPDVNILAGVNGSGKSTILELVFNQIRLGRIEKSQSEKIESINTTFTNGNYICSELYKYNQNETKIEDEYGDKILKSVVEGKDVQVNKYLKGEILTISNNIGSIVHINLIKTFDNILLEAEAVKKLSNDEIKSQLDWELYQVQRKYVNYQLNISKKKDEIIDKGENDIGKKLKSLRQPQQRLIEIIEEVFIETDKKIDKNANELAFILDEKTKLNAYQLSSGEKQMLLILLTVLIQDNKPSVLILDEPEISLHIEWQKKLIAYIRELNPNVQVIIATHSPALIMNGWMDKVVNMSDIVTKTNQN